MLETLNHLQRLAQYGVGYRSYTEQDLDSCGLFKDAVLSILATIVKQERIQLSLISGQARNFLRAAREIETTLGT